jgi:glycosyltransferase involved in cell wall biosynthesis
MRISIILRSISIAGGTRVILMLADQLRMRGHQVVVVAPAPEQPGFWRRVKALIRGKGWLPSEQPDRTYLAQLSIQVSFKLLNESQPVQDRDLPDADIVIATWWETAEWVARLSPSKGKKVYFLQQLESNFGAPADRVEATWRYPMQKIVCSKWLADLARDRFDDPTAIVVPNGIDLTLFHAPRRGKQARPTVGLLYFPAAAVKATGTALKAIELASRQVPDVLVRSFGPTDIQPDVPLPPGSIYVRTPLQQSLREIYSSCDVWLCSSTSEGYHLPPHEAMACRCPVVSTRVGGPIELIKEGENGYLVDVGDTQGLADRLVRVLASSDENWQRMSDAAYTTATQFTWVDAAVLFEKALQSALERRDS